MGRRRRCSEPARLLQRPARVGSAGRCSSNCSFGAALSSHALASQSPRMKSPCLVPLALLGLALSASAQTWTQANPSTSPSARVSVEAVFNPFRQRVVMYGGRTPATLGLQETWTWNGQDWTLQQPHGVSPGQVGAQPRLRLASQPRRALRRAPRHHGHKQHVGVERQQLERGQDQDPTAGQAQLRHGLRHEAQGHRGLWWRGLPVPAR
jgi:hypothetical protein